MCQGNEQEQSTGERKYESGVFHITQTYANNQSNKRRARRQEIKTHSLFERHPRLNENSKIPYKFST